MIRYFENKQKYNNKREEEKCEKTREGKCEKTREGKCEKCHKQIIDKKLLQQTELVECCNKIFINEYDSLFEQVFIWSGDNYNIEEEQKYIVGNICRKVYETFCHFQYNNQYYYDKQYKDQELLNILSHFPYSDNEDLSLENVRNLPKRLLEYIRDTNAIHYTNKKANHLHNVK